MKRLQKNGPGMARDARKPIPVRESGYVGRVDFFDIIRHKMMSAGVGTRPPGKICLPAAVGEMRPVVGSRVVWCGVVWCGVVCIRGIECIIENKFLIFVTHLGNTIYG